MMSARVAASCLLLCLGASVSYVQARIMSPSWTHLVRFLAVEDGQIHLGQVDPKEWPDVGLAIYNGDKVGVRLVTGSAFDGSVTNTTMHISKVCGKFMIRNGRLTHCSAARSHRLV